MNLQVGHVGFGSSCGSACRLLQPRLLVVIADPLAVADDVRADAFRVESRESLHRRASLGVLHTVSMLITTSTPPITVPKP